MDNAPGLTVVVPMFNEADSIDRLRVELARLTSFLGNQCATELLFVDDGSTDDTWNELQRCFGGNEQARFARHAVNSGIAAAIATGIAEAKSEIVASIDADCTYEPVQLVKLLRQLRNGVDMVVASPYHPEGRVVGVAAWRLAISRLASRLYGLVLRNQIHTYTSCFRVYRRSSVVDLPVKRGGFVGVVELLWQLDRRGGTIVECPVELTVRTTGQSKMRVVQTTAAHSRLLAEVAWQKIWQQQST